MAHNWSTASKESHSPFVLEKTCPNNGYWNGCTYPGLTVS
jgi:hypothetical protein